MKVLTVEEASEQLGCSRTKTFELLRKGKLESLRLGKRRMIPQTEIDKLIRQEMA